jgi:hypothetical protein
MPPHSEGSLSHLQQKPKRGVVMLLLYNDRKMKSMFFYKYQKGDYYAYSLPRSL